MLPTAVDWGEASMPNIEFRFAWNGREPEVLRTAQQFWRDLGDALTADEIEERSAELCAAAYSASQMIAVSTVKLTDYPRLGGRFAFYRTVVAPDFRRQGVAARLCAYSRDRLGQWAQENPEEKIKGLLIVGQSDDLSPKRRHLPVVSTHGLDFVFVGFGQTGYQIRVVWFDHAAVE